MIRSTEVAIFNLKKIVNGWIDLGVDGRWEINKGLRINKMFNKEQEKTMVD